MYLRILTIGALAAGFAFAQAQATGDAAGGSTSSSAPTCDLPDPAQGVATAVTSSGASGAGHLASAASRATSTPLDRMAIFCNLSKDQTKQFSAILNAASKSVADLRKQVPASRLQLEAAAQEGRNPDEIKKLADANGMAAAQMTQIAMQTFGELYRLLDPNQKKTGGQQVLDMLLNHGMLAKKNWNE
jgi:hypothetical protein